MVNNIRNNTINEIAATKGLNTLNEIKNAEIIKKRSYTSKQKELLNLFNDLLDIILSDKTLKSENQENENENENEKENRNDKTLMSSKDDDEKGNENKDDDETLSQNEINEIIKGKNDILDEIIDKLNSFEEQIKSLKKEKI